MLSYYFLICVLLFKVQKKYRKYKSKFNNTNKGKAMILSKCAICGSKKLIKKKSLHYWVISCSERSSTECNYKYE